MPKTIPFIFELSDEALGSCLIAHVWFEEMKQRVPVEMNGKAHCHRRSDYQLSQLEQCKSDRT